MTKKADVIAIRASLLEEAEARLKAETKRLREDVRVRKAELEAAKNGVYNVEVDATPLASGSTITQTPAVT